MEHFLVETNKYNKIVGRDLIQELIAQMKFQIVG